MRRLQANRHLELACHQRLEPPASIGVRAGEKRRMRLDDHPLEPVDLARDRLVILRRNLLRIEEAAGVVQLDRAAPAEARTTRSNLLRRSRRAARPSSSVFIHRSHITQRNGHSRLVRKTTAVGTRHAGLVGLFFPRRMRRRVAGSTSVLRAAMRGRTDRVIRYANRMRARDLVASRAFARISLHATARPTPSVSRRVPILPERLKVRRHHAFDARSRGVAVAPSWNRRF